MSVMEHQERLRKNYDDFVASLDKEPPVECEFSVGDTVTFTNEYGVSFSGLKVLGFAKDTLFQGRFIYLDSSCYWFAKKPESLRKE